MRDSRPRSDAETESPTGRPAVAPTDLIRQAILDRTQTKARVLAATATGTHSHPGELVPILQHETE